MSVSDDAAAKRRASKRAHYYKDLEATRAYFRAYANARNAANREKVNAQARELKKRKRATDPAYREKVRECNRRRREKHRDRLNEQHKTYIQRYVANDPDYFKKNSKKVPIAIILRGRAVANAKKKGLTCEISSEWVRERLEQQGNKCCLTGIEFVPRHSGKKHPFGPSIDRINQRIGYTPDNCRIVCWAINRFRADGDDATMMIVARALIEKQG